MLLGVPAYAAYAASKHALQVSVTFLYRFDVHVA